MVRDWPLAIELARRLVDAGGESQSRRIAHFHCELASAALKSSEPRRLETAGREIEAALRADPDHPRPRLLAGELAFAEGEPAKAVRAWKFLQEKRPEFLSLVAKAQALSD